MNLRAVLKLSTCLASNCFDALNGKELEVVAYTKDEVGECYDIVLPNGDVETFPDETIERVVLK